MKLFRACFLALSPLLLAACGSIAPVPSGTSGIVVGPNEIRECGQGKVQFPAGVYTAEVVSEKGTYYLAPERIRTKGVLMGRAERGGIFVSSAPGNPQAAWFGDLSATVKEKPGTNGTQLRRVIVDFEPSVNLP
ncbi:MAG: hypothetical protein K9N47_24575 [Prosthecobacter sp.]|uniref:hypothetical protein n=1 Tax=Prosthecobacter sp. TaxID=1965333 RepID=UPI002605B76B|nr:hypothetical protein [Prosthecobacter sp.]MCF7789320.1 hypothetical protein [Prosthecobacter sp.]